MVRIDGSYGEGGGQIIRTSVSLAAITGQSVEIQNIRAKRSKPGLQPQHLMAVKAAADLCAAELTGADKGSTILVFEPTKKVEAGDYRFEINTAGSAPLVAQTVIMPLVLTGQRSTVSITGGTHNPMAPSSDYLERVYAPALREMGVSITIESPRAGFYPAGGGEINIELTGSSSLFPISKLERLPLRLEAIITTYALGNNVFNRARETIGESIEYIKVRHEEKDSNGPGAAVVIIAEHGGGSAGFTGLGEKGKPMEKVAEEAVGQYLQWEASGAPIDEHLADQLVLPATFASGESRWRTPVVTEHLRTVLWLVGQFIPIDFELGETVALRPIARSS